MPDWTFWVEFVAVVATAIGTFLLVFFALLPYLQRRHRTAEDSKGGALNAAAERLFKKTFVLDAGALRDFSRRLSEGDRVTGVATETTGQRFTLWIVDSRNYAALYREESFTAAERETEVAAAHVDIDIPTTGNWHFVFDARGKQNDREIEFELYRE
ncbi:MAG: hypothetical protein KGJ23_05020 [Euryarchaeota archaeon]|nr:hypothetical protein [Euryarchaeota archaeon]MDE1835960.1 hypothetical protein [Euryarchaeota archaeon]MDE1881103.1 hypothetical protein [Euryarchaeota archaeon]MDE2044362.1 hypothetical protein [Thermoplasmata archaeon]